MKVLLVWPRSESVVLSDELSCCEPLPLEYLAGALKGRHEVEIHDCRLDPPLEQRAQAGATYDVVGVAVPFTCSTRAAMQTAREVKRLWPRALLVLGGHHPTVSNQWLTGCPADYVILGEGGDALLGLADALEKGSPLNDVAGLVPFQRFLADGPPPVGTTARDVKTVAKPDRSLLTRHAQRYFHSYYRPTALIRFSAGCPYRCDFCILWKLTNGRYFTKAVDGVLEELSEISSENLYVVDDEAFIVAKRMHELADAIATSGFRKKFHMYIRADTAVRNPELMEKWRNAGLDSVLVGAESLEEDELDAYKKGAGASETVQAMQLFHSLGVKVRANFIVRPEFERKDFVRVAEQVKTLGVDLPSFSVLTPLPGTNLYERARSEFVVDGPELYDCYHTLFQTKLPVEEFYSALADLVQGTAARTDVPGATQAPVFYYSTGSAFSRMVQAIRDGHKLGEPVSGTPHETPAA
ncbi:radical SAM protein [Corallococcus exercitus]|uniref:Radical SAM protein n=1 Tax=Corallococcus exercitus TaxID=2316736 RepID=A0A7Y4NS64_9BACT|nr:radical SAM protein [Corallococcus exercitus]NOK35480.1 radical SAM protein [Corallococcus exercitus]